MAEFISLKNISKQYGNSVVLKKVSLSLEQNSYSAIVGKNGCGKTTLLHIMAKILRPSQGIVSWHIEDKAEISMLGQASMFYTQWNAYENLLFFARLHRPKLNAQELKLKIKTALEYCSLRDSKNSIETFSKGMLQRLAIARILLVKAKYLFLDEPFNALDLHGQKFLLQILQERGIEELDWKINSFVIIDHDIERVVSITQNVYLGQHGEFSKLAGDRSFIIQELEKRIKTNDR